MNAPQRRAQRALLLVLLLAGLTLAALGYWWSLETSSPPVESVQTPEERRVPSERSITEEPPPALVAPRGMDDALAELEALVERRAFAEALAHLAQQEPQLARLEGARRAELEWLRARVLLGTGRQLEAEVHLHLARAFAQELGEPAAALVASIDESIAALASTDTKPEPEAGQSGDFEIVPVSLSRDFEPLEAGAAIKISPSWVAQNHRLEEFPVFALSEPVYTGRTQLYGAVQLGIGHRELYVFAFDLPANGPPEVWFDRNANYDLTDDGAPLQHEGEGVFSATVTLPMTDILPVYSGLFSIRLFSTESLWQKRFATHYCVTVLEGSVSLSGKRYKAYIADSGFNEADFTNDGIFVDLDGNGRLSAEEHVAHAGILTTGGSRYRFDIGW